MIIALLVIILLAILYPERCRIAIRWLLTASIYLAVVGVVLGLVIGLGVWVWEDVLPLISWQGVGVFAGNTIGLVFGALMLWGLASTLKMFFVSAVSATRKTK